MLSRIMVHVRSEVAQTDWVAVGILSAFMMVLLTLAWLSSRGEEY